MEGERKEMETIAENGNGHWSTDRIVQEPADGALGDQRAREGCSMTPPGEGRVQKGGTAGAAEGTAKSKSVEGQPQTVNSEDT